MKKISLVLLAAVFSLSIYSCRETTENTETNIEEVEADMEETGEEVETELEQAGEEIEGEFEETDDN